MNRSLVRTFTRDQFSEPFKSIRIGLSKDRHEDCHGNGIQKFTDLRLFEGIYLRDLIKYYESQSEHGDSFLRENPKAPPNIFPTLSLQTLQHYNQNFF